MNQDNIVTIKYDDGTFAKVHLFGATVISWMSENAEQLFLSTKSKMDGSKAIRGGIPIVFPNFGPWDCGPQHGFARISWWKPVNAGNTSGCPTASFKLEDNEDTRKIWNFKFQLMYTVSLKPKELTTSLTICNKDSKEFDFTTLLHTYFRVPDISQCTVDGFKGCKFTSKVSGEKDLLEDRDHIKIIENVDSVYAGAGSSGHQIKSGDRTIKLMKLNLDDTVLWNPWSVKAKEMSDFDDDGYLHMVCVEAGHVSNRKVLAAQTEITVSQTLSIIP